MAEDLYACNDDFKINFGHYKADKGLQNLQMGVKLPGHNTTNLILSGNSSLLDQISNQESPAIQIAIDDLKSLVSWYVQKIANSTRKLE